MGEWNTFFVTDRRKKVAFLFRFNCRPGKVSMKTTMINVQRNPSHWQDSGAHGAQLQLPPHCSGGEASAGRCHCAMEPELVGYHGPGEQVTILPTCAVMSTLPTECLEETLQISL